MVLGHAPYYSRFIRFDQDNVIPYLGGRFDLQRTSVDIVSNLAGMYWFLYNLPVEN